MDTGKWNSEFDKIEALVVKVENSQKTSSEADRTVK